jgi:hypothetical protein
LLILYFQHGFQNFKKASIHSTNNPHNYVIGSGTWILMCSFSQYFFCIYQLKIGTKSAFEFHNHRSVYISVILSNLKIKKKIIRNYVMSTYISNFHWYTCILKKKLFYKYLISILFLFFTTKKITIKFVFSHYFDYDDRLYL